MSNLFPSISGGKDSLWMLLEMKRRGMDIKNAIYFDSGWDHPEVTAALDQVVVMEVLEHV